MNHRSHWFLLSFLLLTIVMTDNTQPVLADVAPPPPPSGSNPSTDATNTQVQMASELVTFDISATDINNSGRTKVNAIFKMYNTGSSAEKMVARFPLCNYLDGNCVWSPYPSINDLAVWVDGLSTPVTTTTTTVRALDGSGKDIVIPAWGNFNVAFPPAKVVTVKVAYLALGYNRDPASNMVEYNYVLETGAGWYGPIQQADFIFRLPYDINDKNVEYYSPDNSWTIAGHELHWQAKNFKPDTNLQITILNPVIWQTILDESQNTSIRPNDGEAWGRLAMAYKKAVWTRRGTRNDPAALEMIQLSKEAYQNAVRLLPKDPDWHYGYAELLCELAMWNTDDPTHLTAGDSNLIGCIQQLKDALDLKPKDARSLSLLQAFALPNRGYNVDNWMNVAIPGLVDISGVQPDYLILTPQPSSTPEPIISPTTQITITLTKAQPASSPEFTIGFTPFSSTKVPTQTVTVFPATIESQNANLFFILADLSLVIICFLIGFFWLKKNHPSL